MPKFTDENQVTWDVKTTSIQQGQNPKTSAWFAGVDDVTSRDYSGNTFNQDFDALDSNGTEANHVVWPQNGNPVIRGPGSEDDALSAIRRFAAQEKARGSKSITLRVTSAPDAKPTSLMALLAIAVLVYYLDK